MLTYLLGPFLALLPRRWRDALPFSPAVDWRWATVLSGFAEGSVSLGALLFWYSYYMNLLVDKGLDSAIAGKVPGVTDHEIGFASLVIWATHPLTWFICYSGVEGAVRLCAAAFTENDLGILALFVADKIYLKLAGRSAPSAAKAAGFTEGNFSSYKNAVREKVVVSRLPLVPDEILVTGNGTEEVLEIRTCRRKEDWNPPRTVRYMENFYRLEASSDGRPPRPFRYTLKRVSAGVMGRTVLVYSPDEVQVIAKK